MQRLRGKVYLKDGAIKEWDLTSDGRHKQLADPESWHVLSVDYRDNVFGCARLRPYSFPFEYKHLAVAHSEIASMPEWRTRLERAVRAEIARAQAAGFSFVEAGGWALAEEVRCSTEALRIALTMYGLGQMLGGCIGLTTATLRHGSSLILRRIGGELLSDGDNPIPRYFDSRYNCDMEILRFNSSAPNPRYREWAEQVASDLVEIPVVGAARVPQSVNPWAHEPGTLGFEPLFESA